MVTENFSSGKSLVSKSKNEIQASAARRQEFVEARTKRFGEFRQREDA